MTLDGQFLKKISLLASYEEISNTNICCDLFIAAPWYLNMYRYENIEKRHFYNPGKLVATTYVDIVKRPSQPIFHTKWCIKSYAFYDFCVFVFKRFENSKYSIS